MIWGNTRTHRRPDLGERLLDRLHFYRWMGSVHAIIYGATTGIEQERTEGLTELR